MTSVAILGTAGIPAAYGGFETLAQNLVEYNETLDRPFAIEVWCSGERESDAKHWQHTRLRHLPLSANGISSIPYDVLSITSATFRGVDVILLLGVSGAIALPFVRILSRCKIVTNIDGMEWRRAKWNRLARWWLRLSEKIAVHCSHRIVADNPAIKDYVAKRYDKVCDMIAYGGDHALKYDATGPHPNLPDRYALALCRIEPENNVAMIIEAFDADQFLPLVFVGNWSNSEFGRRLRDRYRNHERIFLIDPIYDPNTLGSIRQGCDVYVHGHSAGGTNPALVEMMHFGVPILAFDCSFNRFTTEGEAAYFDNAPQLAVLVRSVCNGDHFGMGARMRAIASQKYTWAAVGSSYFSLLSALTLDRVAPAP